MAIERRTVALLPEMAVLTRYAPSPTGFLHLGHVANAIYVWGLAHAASGKVLLRIEDHDRQRSRVEYEAALLDDLDWLRFRSDIFSTDDFRRGVCEGRQSDRESVYRDALATLDRRGVLFACECTRKQTLGTTCGGRCRERGRPCVAGVGWRVHLDTGTSRDVLIRDRLGNWTYQWCVTVDDTAQQVSHVIRGEDLRDSTGRQIALGQLLGREQPATFVHHPLIMSTPTRKLSKADGAAGIRELRAAGWRPDQVIGHAARLIGLQDTDVPIDADAVQQFFEGRAWP